MSSVERSRSFDRAAEEYERGRPGYPDALLDALPVVPEATVLDLGAGTGKLTRLLARRYARVVAVEPLDGMRAILEREVTAAEVHAGSAEAIPLADGAVDAVFAGQAFHWFANDAAVAEIARVLRPGGVLALVWNEPTKRSPLPAEYVAYWETVHGPSLDAVRAEPPWNEVIGRGPFGETSEATVPHEQVQTRENVLAFAQSVSAVAHRQDDERARIVRELDARLTDGPFAIPLRAELMWALRA